MKKLVFLHLFILIFHSLSSQTMTPELLWSLGRVNALGVTADDKQLLYTVSYYDKESNKSNTQLIQYDFASKKSTNISNTNAYIGGISFDKSGSYLIDKSGNFSTSDNKPVSLTKDAEYSNFIISPNGKNILFSRGVNAMQTKSDLYPNLPKTEAKIYDDIMFRHWNVWEDGIFNHVHVADYNNGAITNEKDLMPNEAWDSPTTPFGGTDDLAWCPEGKMIAYVAVKKFGKEYAISTNSDIYFYELATGKTKNFTEGMNGYDKHPLFSSNGNYFAWTSMARDGYEADKNDIIIADLKTNKKVNLTKDWDESVNGFIFSKDNKKIYFNAPFRGAVQLFEVNIDFENKPVIRQISEEICDYTAVIAQIGNKLICSRTDMNHATEIYAVDISNGKSEQLTKVNDEAYSKIKMSKVEKEWINTTDGKKMLAWVIYPPDFDPSKKYPTLLYCQGGPQSALSQYYSFRWNFQLIAANGYIVVAPNRRGMPGWGTAWNEQISGDWGGQVMKDYLSAIDQFSVKAYVDKSRLGAVGASYGGYSVMMLAGIHENRFKTFISHCGSYNLDSWYGSTEEMWFANYDLKGPFWNKEKPKSYELYSPHKFVQNWNTPILIIQGGRDYRIPDIQAFEAFTAARMQNVKSRLLYIPDEGHHVLKIQNGLLWQSEFFRWLKETL
ncbi:MAG: S9 family peptidase [Saprospiraceae bacterium]|nr:S9 family peptidase [Saprospiraceae bacterium]